VQRDQFVRIYWLQVDIFVGPKRCFQLMFLRFALEFDSPYLMRKAF